MAAQTTCLSILVAKLSDDVSAGFVTHIGEELPLADDARAPDIPENVDIYEDYLYLNTVHSLPLIREMKYDEGDTRIIYRDVTLTVTATLHHDMEFGPLFDDPNDTFSQRCEKICHFLENQGLAIQFIDWPISIRRLVASNMLKPPLNSQNDPSIYTQYSGERGWLVDTHNGPKTRRVSTEMIAGGNARKLTWEVTFRTAHTDTEHTPDWLRPRISSELRLDIDHNGDLIIIVEGTIYADSLPEIYAARDWLNLHYQPAFVSGITNGSHVSTWEEDKWAQVNGFTKKVQFNVERNGRSARFTMKYEQVKSNNAFPIGLRDVTFDQEISSNLIGGNVFSGKGFRTWKDDFNCSIMIPQRLSQHYAWFVFHNLVNQQMRRAELVFDSTTFDPNDPANPNSKSETKTTKDEVITRAIPLRLKIKNQHFGRKLKFHLGYLLLSPLSKVITTSCILDRVNNDYTKKINDPNITYNPDTLSEQWFAWNQSTDTAQAFDPTQPGAQNLGSPGRPHRDIAGLEINDTGHNHNAYETMDDQNIQRNILISTVFDPNEEDPSYLATDPTDPADPDQVGYDTSLPYPKRTADYLKSLNNYAEGNPPNQPSSPLSILRPGVSINPIISWLFYNQDYTLTETNPTIPTESLAPRTKDDFADQTEAFRYDLEERNSPSFYTPNPDPELLSQVAAETGFKLRGRVRDRDPSDPVITDVNDPGYNDNQKVAVRRTYAAAPSRIYLTVRGSAARVGFKIPIPTVLYIAGQKAVRVGPTRARHTNMSGDSDVPVYLAMWEQTYTVDKSMIADDILDNIEDIGANILYS